MRAVPRGRACVRVCVLRSGRFRPRPSSPAPRRRCLRLRVSPPSPSGDVLRAASAREVFCFFRPGLVPRPRRPRVAGVAVRSRVLFLRSPRPGVPAPGVGPRRRRGVRPPTRALPEGVCRLVGRAGAGPFAARAVRAPRYLGQTGRSPFSGPVSSYRVAGSSSPGRPRSLSPSFLVSLSLSAGPAGWAGGPTGRPTDPTDPTETRQVEKEGEVLPLSSSSLPPSSCPPSEPRPQIRRGDPLNLSILVSGGKETNQDSLSNGE